MPRVRRPAGWSTALSAALFAASLGAPSACSQEIVEDLPQIEAADDASVSDGVPTDSLPVYDDDDLPADALPPAFEADDRDGEVPGAASTEPVLRCVYRPHLSRVPAIYEFLKTHAAAGVDVSVRPVERVASEEAPKLTDAPAAGDFGDFPGGDMMESNARRTARPVAEGDGPLELVVVAPPEVQRALGQFLQLCVSAEPVKKVEQRSPTPVYGNEFGTPIRRARDVPDGFQDPMPADFGSADPPTPSDRDGFSADFGANPAAVGRPGDGAFVDGLPGDAAFGDELFGEPPAAGSSRNALRPSAPSGDAKPLQD